MTLPLILVLFKCLIAYTASLCLSYSTSAFPLLSPNRVKLIPHLLNFPYFTKEFLIHY